MNLCNQNTIKELMAEAGIVFRKEYGQNFLINPIIPEEIAENCTDNPDSMILEIGPGIGCLTAQLAARYPRVVAVEIDKGLIPVLAKTLAEFDNVTVIEGDIMKTDIKAIVDTYAQGRAVSVCANLPYYITTPILMYLLESGIHFDSITVMVQNEVCSRLVSAPGSKDYGAITAVLGYYGEAERLFRVGAGCFMPAPKVASAVVRINLYPTKKYTPKNEKLFFSLIRAAFEMRRKTLQNAISAKLGISKEQAREAILALGLDENIRGEKLSTEQFVLLSDILANN